MDYLDKHIIYVKSNPGYVRTRCQTKRRKLGSSSVGGRDDRDANYNDEEVEMAEAE